VISFFFILFREYSTLNKCEDDMRDESNLFAGIFIAFSLSSALFIWIKISRTMKFAAIVQSNIRALTFDNILRQEPAFFDEKGR
jgi:hypothetical protein